MWNRYFHKPLLVKRTCTLLDQIHIYVCAKSQWNLHISLSCSFYCHKPIIYIWTTIALNMKTNVVANKMCFVFKKINTQKNEGITCPLHLFDNYLIILYIVIWIIFIPSQQGYHSCLYVCVCYNLHVGMLYVILWVSDWVTMWTKFSENCRESSEFVYLFPLKGIPPLCRIQMK